MVTPLWLLCIRPPLPRITFSQQNVACLHVRHSCSHFSTYSYFIISSLFRNCESPSNTVTTVIITLTTVVSSVPEPPRAVTNCSSRRRRHRRTTLPSEQSLHLMSSETSVESIGAVKNLLARNASRPDIELSMYFGAFKKPDLVRPPVSVGAPRRPDSGLDF